MENPDRTYYNPAEHLMEEQMMRYLRDEMSDAERHRLERHVLECELCSDALEGMELLEPEQAEAGLQDLKGRFAERVGKNEKKEIPLYWRWAAAASLLLLSGAAYLLIENFPLMNQERENTAVEQEELMEEAPPISLQKEEEITGVEELEKLPVPVPPKTIRDREESRESPTSEAPSPESPSADKEAGAPFSIVTPAEEELVEEIEIEFPEEERQESVLEEIVFEEAPPAGREPEQEKQVGSQKKNTPVRIRGMSSLRRTENEEQPVTESISIDLEAEEKVVKPGYKELKGKVTDASGYPLPGVAVRIANSRTGVTTNFDGEYSLQLPLTDTTLLISFVGFETKEVEVEDTTTQLIAMLEEDVKQLQEVVVTGAGRGVEEVSSPQPVGGMQSYRKYLREKQRYPGRAAEAGVEGRVVVEFFVEPDGSLSNFSVLNSLGNGLDEEAIRLIKEGPDWEPATSGGLPLRKKVKIRIRFRKD